jgi:Zn-dependent protease
VSQRPPQDYDYDPGSFSDYELEQLRPGDELRPYEPIHPRGTNWKKILERIWAPIAALIALTIKFSAFAFKFFGIFISVAAYALIWGWRFAVGFVLLILVHELGHYVEARRQGLHPSLPTFVPFIGAYVTFRQAGDPWRGAIIALAGPFAGGVGAAVCWGLAGPYDSNLLQALAYTGFLLNLFNLLPFLPFDGGATVQSARLLAHAGTYYDRSSRPRSFALWSMYLGLAAVLAYCMWKTHVPQHRL